MILKFIFLGARSRDFSDPRPSAWIRGKPGLTWSVLSVWISGL